MLNNGKTSIPSECVLPKVKTGLKDLEKAAGLSEWVIVKVDCFTNLTIGRYIHFSKEWEIKNMQGDFKVVEWWDLPTQGTGTPCS